MLRCLFSQLKYHAGPDDIMVLRTWFDIDVHRVYQRHVTEKIYMAAEAKYFTCDG